MEVFVAFVLFTLPTYSLIRAHRQVTWSHIKLIYWRVSVSALVEL